MKNRTSRRALSLIGLAIAVYLLVILVQTIKRNHDLQKQIDSLQGHINQLTDEQDNLKYEVQYYQTEAFKEREARAKLGLMAPGEGVIILPKPNVTPAAANAAKAATKNKANWQQWWSFLFG